MTMICEDCTIPIPDGVADIKTGRRGYIHSVLAGGTVDGPGIRYTVFFSGCPLRCLYCHNPDTRRKMAGELKSADEIVADALRYQSFYKGQGGITLTGGEPLFQMAFCEQILKSAKAAGLHTALDTSGYTGKRTSRSLLEYADLILLDIKSFDAKTYQKVTAHKLQPTLDFAELAAEMKIPVRIRCTVVPDLSDDLNDFRRLGRYLSGLGNIERVELQPFHKYGEEKWRKSDLSYELYETETPSPRKIAEIATVFENCGLKTV